MRKRKEPRPLPVKLVEMTAEDALARPGRVSGIGADLRDGVYVHSFICHPCGLHFNLYSWQSDRHEVRNMVCPECGNVGQFAHFRATVNESSKFGAGGTEIHDLCPHPGSRMMDDTTSVEAG